MFPERGLQSPLCENPDACTRQETRDLLTSYVRIWSLWQLFQSSILSSLSSLVFTSASENATLESPSAGLASLTCVLSIIVVNMFPTVPIVIISSGVAIISKATLVPAIYDFEYWGIHLQLTVLLIGLHALIANHCQPISSIQRNLVAEQCGLVIRTQMVIFYSAAGFWKLNNSFWNSTVSCAPVLFVQLLATYLPAAFITQGLVNFVVRVSPAITIAVELTIPLLLAIPGKLRLLGVALGILFHLIILFAPSPNNAGGFAVTAVCFYFFFLPNAAADTVKANLQVPSLRSVSAMCVVMFGMCIGVHKGDYAFPIYFALLTVVLPALHTSSIRIHTASAPSNAISVPRGIKSAILGLAVVYAYLLPVLGLQDMGAVTMFANLHVYSGSNHFLLPTGLLFSWYGSYGSASAGATFSGGVVRVDSTNSSYVNERYPAEVTAMLEPAGVSTLLRAAGHTGRQFDPYETVVLGPGFVSRRVGGPFVPYLLPAVELRRLLAKARSAGESFSLVYSKLPTNSSSKHERVYLEEEGGRLQNCTLWPSGKACVSTEVALQPPPSWWASRFLRFFPIPVEPQAFQGELGCLA